MEERVRRNMWKGAIFSLLAVSIPAALAQTVSVSPGYTTIGVNQTVQYTATVTGLTNTSGHLEN